MKNQLTSFLFLRNSLVILILMLVAFSCKETQRVVSTAGATSDASATTALTANNSTTSLIIKNNTAMAVEVVVVLAALGGACPSTHPPITAAQLKAAGFCSNVINSGNPPYAGKCTFNLAAHASQTFPNLPNTCLSGGVTFGGYPTCPDTQFPNGYTTAEFTLSPSSGNDEALDVSLVNGKSYSVDIVTSGGGTWSYGANNTPISKITTKPLGQNVGNPGVYPENCTVCTALSGPPVCPGFSNNPSCQPSAICNVQRSVSQSGGTVTIIVQP